MAAELAENETAKPKGDDSLFRAVAENLNEKTGAKR
jgi:hypothetical protein